MLKQLMQGDKINPKSSLAPNSRPIQQSHSRSVRTNIYFPQAKQTTNNNDGLASKPVLQVNLFKNPTISKNLNFPAKKLFVHFAI
jgi:hypothetical protein